MIESFPSVARVGWGGRTGTINVAQVGQTIPNQLRSQALSSHGPEMKEPGNEVDTQLAPS